MNNCKHDFDYLRGIVGTTDDNYEPRSHLYCRKCKRDIPTIPDWEYELYNVIGKSIKEIKELAIIPLDDGKTLTGINIRLDRMREILKSNLKPYMEKQLAIKGANASRETTKFFMDYMDKLFLEMESNENNS